MASGVWILAEQRDGRVERVSYELLTRGLELAAKRGCELSAVLMGHDVNAGDVQELIDRGADRVLLAEAPELSAFTVEPYGAVLLALIRQHEPEVLLAGATSTGRTLMPYVAIHANAGLTADCTHLDIDPKTGELLQTRPAIGGNIMATIKTPERRPQMATVRPRSTKPAPRQPGRRCDVVRFSPRPEMLASRAERLSYTRDEHEIDIQEADIVVCVGRGIKRPESLPIARSLADALGGALAATREVVDRGWLSYPHQVGLSGKTISPKLYIGLGVSGTIQHLAGMQTAELIVAVNTDPEAAIFKVADVGIVGDLFEVTPELTRRLKARAAHG